MRFYRMIAAAALGLAACSQAGPEATALARPVRSVVHPISGLAVVPLKIRSGGKVHRFRVEVAGTGEEQAKGLMFRRAMGANEGMIFPMQPPRHASFWMHNTVLSLDLIFIGTDGRIATIAASATPMSDAPIPSGAVVKGVLELNAGTAARLGIRPGDRVDW